MTSTSNQFSPQRDDDKLTVQSLMHAGQASGAGLEVTHG